MAELDDSALAKDDSLESAMTNIVLSDFARYAFRPNCRVAFWDACYNGSWHRENCIANEYIFQPGKTICGLGGSVNVLQDKWPDRFAGLLEQGVMIGFLNQLNPDLEMHVVGDPTFAFFPEQDHSLNDLISSGKQKDWKRLLRHSPHPDIQALALHQLQESKELSDQHLLEYLKTSPYESVRLEASCSSNNGIPTTLSLPLKTQHTTISNCCSVLQSMRLSKTVILVWQIRWPGNSAT